MPINYPVLYKSMDPRADATVSAAVQTAIADAEQLWGPEKFDGVFPINGFGIGKLKCTEWTIDTSGSAGGFRATGFWGFSQAVASAWETYVDLITSDSAYHVITGVFNYDAAPDTPYIKIIADGVEYPVMDLSEMWGWDVATAYFAHPIIVRPEKQLRIKCKSQTTGLKAIGFIGYTIAKRSYLFGEI